VRDGHAGNLWELPTPFLALNQRAIRTLWNAVSGRRIPSVAQRSIASIIARNSIEVATVFRKFWRMPRSSGFRDRVGKMLRAGPEINPHGRRLRQVVAAVSV